MKKTIARIVLATLVLLTSGSAPAVADGGIPLPWCCPGCSCNN